MNFTNINDFIAMGGHGFYVWLAYGVFLIAVMYLWILPLLKQRQLLKSIQFHAGLAEQKNPNKNKHKNIKRGGQ